MRRPMYLPANWDGALRPTPRLSKGMCATARRSIRRSPVRMSSSFGPGLHDPPSSLVEIKCTEVSRKSVAALVVECTRNPGVNKPNTAERNSPHWSAGGPFGRVPPETRTIGRRRRGKAPPSGANPPLGTIGAKRSIPGV